MNRMDRMFASILVLAIALTLGGLLVVKPAIDSAREAFDGLGNSLADNIAEQVEHNRDNR